MYMKDTEHITYGFVDPFHYSIGLRILGGYQAFGYSVIPLNHFSEFSHEFGSSFLHYFFGPGPFQTIQ
eukprot:4454701-Ditylum_brightwellii.AAC.1